MTGRGRAQRNGETHDHDSCGSPGAGAGAVAADGPTGFVETGRLELRVGDRMGGVEKWRSVSVLKATLQHKGMATRPLSHTLSHSSLETAPASLTEKAAGTMQSMAKMRRAKLDSSWQTWALHLVPSQGCFVVGVFIGPTHHS